MDTFALPDLRGRVPIHRGQGPGLTRRTLGEGLGSEYVTLTSEEIPAHGHGVVATLGKASRSNPEDALFSVPEVHAYADHVAGRERTMAADFVGKVGAGRPHSNLMQYTVLNFFICTYGEYPGRH